MIIVTPIIPIIFSGVSFVPHRLDTRMSRTSGHGENQAALFSLRSYASYPLADTWTKMTTSELAPADKRPGAKSSRRSACILIM